MRRRMLASISGAKWTNPYPTDGLVLHIDGEWNAGGGLQDDHSIVDITGNHSLEVVDGLIENNRIVVRQQSERDAVAAYFTELSEIAYPQVSFYILFGAYFNAVNWGNHEVATHKQFYVRPRNNIIDGTVRGKSQLWGVNQNIGKQLNGDYYVCCSNKKEEVWDAGWANLPQINVNGRYVDVTAKQNSTLPTSIGNIVKGSGGVTQKIAVLLVWNRALSEEEMSEVDLISKARFVLP